MWIVIVFFNVINRSYHYFLNFSHDFRLKIEMFVVSLIIDCNKMISFFKSLMWNFQSIFALKWYLNRNVKEFSKIYKKSPVRKTSVSDRSSSEKSPEKLTPLKSVENSQNYQIWSRIDRVIKTFLFISSSYNARRKRVEKK